MQTRISFDTSDDSKQATLSIASSHPISIPELIEHVEQWLKDTKLLFAQEILHRQELVRSGKLVPFRKEVQRVDHQDRPTEK